MMEYPTLTIHEIAIEKCSRSGSRSTSGIINNRLSFEQLVTPQQCAEYFGLKYDGLLDEVPLDTTYRDLTREDQLIIGKIHSFTDPNNENCKIFISEYILDSERGIFKGDWLDSEEQELTDYLNQRFGDMSDVELERFIAKHGYPLREFFKDYNDLPPNVKKSIGEIVWTDQYVDIGDCRRCYTDGDENKSMIQMHGRSITTVGETSFKDESNRDYDKYNDYLYYGDGTIAHNPRSSFYHEVGHSYSHWLGCENKEEWQDYWDIDSSYMASSYKYKKAKKDDKELNGDQWATEYGQRARKNDEECADITSAVLLNHLKDKDPNYDKYRMHLANGELISIDEFFEKYPNRVKAVKEMMGLD